MTVAHPQGCGLKGLSHQMFWNNLCLTEMLSVLDVALSLKADRKKNQGREETIFRLPVWGCLENNSSFPYAFILKTGGSSGRKLLSPQSH